jgi:hypothetical protein
MIAHRRGPVVMAGVQLRYLVAVLVGLAAARPGAPMRMKTRGTVRARAANVLP